MIAGLIPFNCCAVTPFSRDTDLEPAAREGQEEEYDPVSEEDQSTQNHQR